MTNVSSWPTEIGEQMSWNNPDKDWGPHQFDARHRLSLMGMFDLPFGFGLGTIICYNSGNPYNITLGYDANEDGQLLDYPEGVNRFSGRGKDFLSIEARIRKDFKLKPFNIQLFVDIFNLTNRVNFVARWYIGNQQSQSFGEPTEAYDPRLIQLGIRIDF
jgi:hypothetical protein